MFNWMLVLIGCDDHLISRGADDTTQTHCVGDCDELAPTSRFARLTTVQWEQTAQDLLYLDGPTGLSGGFIGDPLSEGFDNNALSLSVGPELWLDHQRAAEALAEQVVHDARLYGQVVPQDPRTGGAGIEWGETVEAEGPEISADNGATVNDGHLLWSTGELRASFDVPQGGTYLVSARVWADQAGPEPAAASLGIDGTDLLTSDVTAISSSSAEILEVAVELSAGSHEVSVGFLNDYYDAYTYEDRNLYVDWLALEGVGSTLGASTAGEAEAEAWIGAFGLRAHRSPLTAAQIASYQALFSLGPELVGSGDDFADGVQLVISAMLQSPHFLYRIELSDAPLPDGSIPLSGYEIASRLSFALWNTMPDEALFAEASSGALDSEAGVRAAAERMLGDERAHEAIADLHRQLLHVDNYRNIFKSEALFPSFSETTPASMQAEVQAFVGDIVWGGGGVHALYTAPHSFVNEDLAPIYGVEAQGSELQRVDLDPSQRAGLLTLSGFLALEADSTTHNPIRRGVFVNHDVVCKSLPPPPDDVTPLPPPDGVRTTRELVDAHTGEGTCGAGCHSSLINPPGFAFEAYDALGQHRTTEHELPIDASGSWTIDGQTQSWSDAVGFAAVVADSVEAHRCYSQHLLEFLHGRAVASEDDALLQRQAALSRDEDRAIRDLIVDLVSTRGFRHRSPVAPEVSR